MRKFLLIIGLFAGVINAKTLPATSFSVVNNFIDEMVKKHNFDKQELHILFSKVELKVREKPKPRTSKKPKKKPKKPITWDKYRSLFITDARVRGGVIFWRDNFATLKRAEQKYKVPAQIIVAILGIETNYGNKKGEHPTLQTLSKYAFGNYRRHRFYRKELISFLLLVRENNISPLSIKGSWAGALGYPQFISSSYRHYAVDFDGDKKADLLNSKADAIGSIANYLSKHRWRKNGDFISPASIKAAKYAKTRPNRPRKTANYWRQKNINLADNISPKTKVAFIKMVENNKLKVWATFQNFYAITRYNHENKYAMVAYRLSELLRQNLHLNINLDLNPDQNFYPQDL